jgi:hypothetical protein
VTSFFRSEIEREAQTPVEDKRRAKKRKLTGPCLMIGSVPDCEETAVDSGSEDEADGPMLLCSPLNLN